MSERNIESGANAPAEPPQTRIWAFTMDGYLPPVDATATDAAPTAGDLAADRLIARFSALGKQLTARLHGAGPRARDGKHERTAR